MSGEKTMSFKKNKYVFVKKALSKELATFLYNYFLIKQKVYDVACKKKYISPFEKILGYYEKAEDQVPGSYANYADIAGDTLLLRMQDVVEQKTNLKLYPNYSYQRTYKTGDDLKKHIDRFSCEISTTVFLGGDEWPIYMNLTGDKNNKGKKFNLKPGDMIIYRGNILEHWREPLQGNQCVQLFLHYTDVKTKGAKENIYDSKPCIGLPNWFKNKTLYV